MKVAQTYGFPMFATAQRLAPAPSVPDSDDALGFFAGAYRAKRLITA